MFSRFSIIYFSFLLLDEESIPVLLFQNVSDKSSFLFLIPGRRSFWWSLFRQTQKIRSERTSSMVIVGAEQVAQKKQQAGVLQLKPSTVEPMWNPQKFCVNNEGDPWKGKHTLYDISYLCTSKTLPVLSLLSKYTWGNT